MGNGKVNPILDNVTGIVNYLRLEKILRYHIYIHIYSSINIYIYIKVQNWKVET